MKGQKNTGKQFVEEYLINHILNNRASRDMLIDNLPPEYFSTPEYAHIFKAVKSQKRKRKQIIDIRDIVAYLEEAGQTSAIGVAYSIKDKRFIDNT